MYEYMNTGIKKIKSWFLSKSDHRLIFYSGMNNSGSKVTESILKQSLKMTCRNLKATKKASSKEIFLRGNLIKLNDFENLGEVVCGTTSPFRM